MIVLETLQNDEPQRVHLGIVQPPLRRSRIMTLLCSGKMTQTENTVWRAPTAVCN